MLSLTRQIQIACDTVELAVTRIAQAEPRPMADEEKVIDELRDRIAKTIGYRGEADLTAFESREAAEITLKLPNLAMSFTGQSFVTDFTLPNFFHMTTPTGCCA